MPGNWPVFGLPSLPLLSCASPEAMLPTQGATYATFASAVWPTGNRAILWPFRLNAAQLATLLWLANGAVVSGNVDLGIYAPDFTRIVSTGSTAQTGTSAIQTFNIADTLLGPGDFYLAVTLDNGTGTVYRTANNAVSSRSAGMIQQAAAFPLPATLTPALIGSAFLPLSGLLFWPRTEI